MTSRPPRARLALAAGAAALAVALGACSTPEASSAPETPSASATVSPARNDVDVDFTRGMVVHHRSALEMAETAASRAEDPRVADLAARVTASQEPEIERMTSWLEAWGEEAPSGTDGMDGMGGMDEAGMMSGEEMDRLRSASGPSFDEMWLRAMVVHHRGAVDMARTEITDGENPEAIALAKTITSDQEAEIDEMEQVLQG